VGRPALLARHTGFGAGCTSNAAVPAAKSGSALRPFRSLGAGTGASDPPRHAQDGAALPSGGQASAASPDPTQHSHIAVGPGVMRHSPPTPSQGRISSETVRTNAMNQALIGFARR
jgi:hypothetical protein